MEDKSPTKAEHEQHHWGDRAQSYAKNQEGFSLPSGIILGNMMELPKAKRIIETGCGPAGLTLFWLERLHHCEKYVSCDITEQMLEVGKHRKEKAFGKDGKKHHEFVKGDICDLSQFADGSFDAYVCSMAMHHAGDTAKGIKEAYRVLDKGGRIGLLEMGDRTENFVWVVRGELMKRIQASNPDKKEEHQHHHHHHHEEKGGSTEKADEKNEKCEKKEHSHKHHNHDHNWFIGKEGLCKAIEDGGFEVEFFWEEKIRLPFYKEEDVIGYLEDPMHKDHWNKLNDDQKKEMKEFVVGWWKQYKEKKQPMEMNVMSVIGTKK